MDQFTKGDIVIPKSNKVRAKFIVNETRRNGCEEQIALFVYETKRFFGWESSKDFIKVEEVKANANA